MSSKRRILTLSTYPIAEPIHGGQHRLVNIIRAFRDAGHEVQSIGVIGSESYPPQEGFEPYPGFDPLTSYIKNPFLMDDWAIGCLFAKDKSYFQSLKKNIKIKFDVIYVEHPWLFEFAKIVRKQLNKNAVLIYGSANVECELKTTILRQYMSDTIAVEYGHLVAMVEKDAISDADYVVCVSQHDLDWITAQGCRNVVLAPNGVSERSVDYGAIAEANGFSQGKKFALYSASAHPPNISGFYDFFGKGIAALSPDQKIIIAGGAGPSIQGDPRFASAGGLGSVCSIAGIVSEPCLAGLLHTAHAIILPISGGGGTNLKTAEALWSGRHIVASTVAFRGFEDFMDAPGVRIADTSTAMLHLLREAMEADPLALSASERERRRSVLWGSTLSALTRLVETL